MTNELKQSPANDLRSRETACDKIKTTHLIVVNVEPLDTDKVKIC